MTRQQRFLPPMSTASIKSAFVGEVGPGITCHLCTMNYIDGGKMQLLRFYIRRGSADEEIVEVNVPRGESLIVAARERARSLRENA